MKLMCCWIFVACLLIVSGMVALAHLHIEAATNNPTISMRRNNALNGRVVLGDFNGDRVADAVASETTSGTPSTAITALGTANGTFATAHRIGCSCRPLAAGDFNRDGRLDLLVVEEPSPDVSMFVLRGNGDATFHRTAG